ncbi:MAG: McrC family protein [Treponema sp.]|nr:McrC family protein [Treponema sp.]
MTNLQIIKDKTISELQKDLGILVYPPKLDDTNDKIKNQVIFNLKKEEDSFVLETGNIMGFIGCNDTELNICSRFTHKVKKEQTDKYETSEENDFFLHYMLAKVCHFNLTTLESSRTPDKIFDFLPFLFPQYLIAALNQGLYKEYQTHEYNDSNVRGVVDINRHIRLNIPPNGKVAYHTREYSFDNPITELVRHTIEYMRANEVFKHILSRNEETKAAVSKIDYATPKYNRMERNRILSKTAKAIRSPYYYKYRDLQKICRMILLREKIRYDSSSNKIYGILFDGAWLWEEYLATMLMKKGYEHPRNKNQSGGYRPLRGKNDHSAAGLFIPDFYRPSKTLDGSLCASCILDAKYKVFDFNNPPADDLAQMIAYMHTLKCEKGYFVFPSKKGDGNRDWNIIGLGGELGVRGLYIPQDAQSHEEFITEIEKSEKMFLI